jgi:hypothetical protein
MTECRAIFDGAGTDLELLGTVRMKTVSYCWRRSGRVYDQRGFEAKKEIPVK